MPSSSTFASDVPPGSDTEGSPGIDDIDGDEEVPRVDLLLFRVGAQRLVVPLSGLVEVGLLSDIRRIPHADRRVLLGVVAVRGRVTPCVDLAQLVGAESLPADASPKAMARRRLLILQLDEEAVAFPVDEVMGQVEIGVDRVHPVPAWAGLVGGPLSGMVELTGGEAGVLGAVELASTLDTVLAR